MKKSSKYRVIPGLSVKGPEIRQRMGNRSFIPSTDGLTFSTEKELAEISNMNKAELARSYYKGRDRVRELEAQVIAERERVQRDQVRAKEQAWIERMKEQLRKDIESEKGGKNG